MLKVANLLHSLRQIMFQPTDLYQDIVVTKVIINPMYSEKSNLTSSSYFLKVMDLLVMVTEILHLKDLQIQCQELKVDCQSTRYTRLLLLTENNIVFWFICRFYLDPDLYWVAVQGLLISVWFQILFLWPSAI